MSRAEGEVLANPETLEASECILDRAACRPCPLTQAFWLLASLAAAMASSSRTPPPAASQGVGLPLVASQGLASQADVFNNNVKVASYNVGASQEEAFQNPCKLEGFKMKLKVSSKGETGRRRSGLHPPPKRPSERPGPSVGRGPAPPGVALRAVGTNVRSGLRPG